MTISTTPTTSSRPALAAVAGIALAGALAALPVDAAADPGPRVVIEQTVEQVLAVLRDGARTPAERRHSIEEIAYARFDMRTMSRLVLSRNWKKFSKTQREAYIREFKEYLANNYGDRIDRYDQQQVDITGERREPRGDVTVMTKIVGGEFENAVVDYRLRRNGGEWKIIDVTVEGISLVSNYRDQFKEVVSRGGPDELLSRLREKNAAGISDDEI